MARKDWLYVPIPLEMARILDEVVEKEAKKYGITDRLELIRALLGDFIELYDKNGGNLHKTRRIIRGNNIHNNKGGIIDNNK
jgi:hypothetical protein